MEKIKVVYVGEWECIVMCASLTSRVKKNDIIEITSEELLELGDSFQKVPKKKELKDG
jgi:hypothetical protein